MISSHQFQPVALRAYDIRGRVDIDIGEADAYALGLAFGTFLKMRGGHTVCTGYDGRASSPIYETALVKGLRETGMYVSRVGLGPSPLLYYAVKSSGADAGVMVTGSHNPKDYNGFKMMLQDAPVYGALIQDISDIAARGDFKIAEQAGKVTDIDLEAAYVERLLKDCAGAKPFKIAWDAGNGAAGPLMRQFTDQLSGEHILLYEDVDGSFPNHHPDPTVDDNLADLIDVVLSQGCDFGIALDGDGDRIGVVDCHGRVLRCDTLLMLYADEILKNYPDTPIIADVKCSQSLFDYINTLGGRAIAWKSGHSMIKAKMAETGAKLAGELSGHIFFADKHYGYDDGLYCAARLIHLLSNTEMSLDALVDQHKITHSTPEIRLFLPEEDKFDVMDPIAKAVCTMDNVREIIEVDGLRVLTDQGWWLIRPSNTQNALTFRAESLSEDGLTNLLKGAKALLLKCYPFQTEDFEPFFN